MKVTGLLPSRRLRCWGICCQEPELLGLGVHAGGGGGAPSEDLPQGPLHRRGPGAQCIAICTEVQVGTVLDTQHHLMTCWAPACDCTLRSLDCSIQMQLVGSRLPQVATVLLWSRQPCWRVRLLVVLEALLPPCGTPGGGHVCGPAAGGAGRHGAVLRLGAGLLHARRPDRESPTAAGWLHEPLRAAFICGCCTMASGNWPVLGATADLQVAHSPVLAGGVGLYLGWLG